MTVLRLLGAALVVLAGAGGGMAWGLRRRAVWQQVSAFAALTEYLLTAIRYQAWPCAVLLQNAAQDPRFAALDLADCQDFAALPVPDALGEALAAQARQVFLELGAAPHQRACQLLARLLAQCRGREAETAQAAAEAARLYPRLGLCAGLLAVIFWL